MPQSAMRRQEGPLLRRWTASVADMAASAAALPCQRHSSLTEGSFVRLVRLVPFRRGGLTKQYWRKKTRPLDRRR